LGNEILNTTSEIINLGKKKYMKQIQSFYRVIQENLGKMDKEK